DIWMLQPADGLSLGAKPIELFRTGVRARREHLQSDTAVDVRLPRLINNAGSAAPDLADDLELATRRVSVDRHRCSRALYGRRGRRGGAENLVQEDLLAERFLQFRKPPHERFQPAVLAVLLTQKQLGIHEIQSAFRVVKQFWITGQIMLGRSALS